MPFSLRLPQLIHSADDHADERRRQLTVAASHSTPNQRHQFSITRQQDPPETLRIPWSSLRAIKNSSGAHSSLIWVRRARHNRERTSLIRFLNRFGPRKWRGEQIGEAGNDKNLFCHFRWNRTAPQICYTCERGDDLVYKTTTKLPGQAKRDGWDGEAQVQAFTDCRDTPAFAGHGPPADHGERCSSTGWVFFTMDRQIDGSDATRTLCEMCYSRGDF